MKDFNTATGVFFKEIRKNKKITLVEASKSIGKSKSWLGEIEQGHNSIYFNDFMTLMKIYDYSPDTFNERLNELLKG